MEKGGLCGLSRRPPPLLPQLLAPLPASSFFNTSFSGVGAPFREQQGFPWSLQPLWLGQFLGPGFHLLSTPFRRQHPTHPTQGL